MIVLAVKERRSTAEARTELRPGARRGLAGQRVELVEELGHRQLDATVRVFTLAKLSSQSSTENTTALLLASSASASPRSAAPGSRGAGGRPRPRNPLRWCCGSVWCWRATAARCRRCHCPSASGWAGGSAAAGNGRPAPAGLSCGTRLRAALGELAEELLGSRRCVPARALAHGFVFAHLEIASALAAELG